MLDALCLIGMVTFFGFLIYTIVMRTPKKGPVPTTESPEPLPASPIGLFCSLCHMPAVLVNNEEYIRIMNACTKIYCERCMTTVEAYKRQKSGP